MGEILRLRPPMESMLVQCRLQITYENKLLSTVQHSAANAKQQIENIWDVNMFVSRVDISLRILGLEKKSLVKMTRLLYNSRVIEVYTMDKLVRVLCNLGIVVSNPNRSSMFRLSIIQEVAINTPDFVDNTSGPQGRRFVRGKRTY